MTEDEFRLLSKEQKFKFVDEKTGAEKDIWIKIMRAQKEEDSRSNTKANKSIKDITWLDGLLQGKALIAIGAIIIIFSIFYSPFTDSYDPVFNMGKGITKLLLNLSGFGILIVGAIFEAADRISARLGSVPTR